MEMKFLTALEVLRSNFRLHREGLVVLKGFHRDRRKELREHLRFHCWAMEKKYQEVQADGNSYQESKAQGRHQQPPWKVHCPSEEQDHCRALQSEGLL
jgi:hypothetical protein